MKLKFNLFIGMLQLLRVSTKIKKIALEFHNNVNDIKVVNLISKIKECGFEIKIEDSTTQGMLYAKKL